MAHLALLALLVIAAFPVQCLGAAAPPLGECCHYKLGGFSSIRLLRVHFYVCCNNCDEDGGNPRCDRVTYDEASNKDYCGHCGEDLGEAKFKSDPFDCGGCDGQDLVKAECDKKHGWVFKGFCWIWSTCFEKRCKRRFPAGAEGAQALQGASYDYDYGSFCGNGRCDSGEDHTSCPFDCCPEYNPDKCKHECHKCPPRCCGETGCCT